MKFGIQRHTPQKRQTTKPRRRRKSLQDDITRDIQQDIRHEEHLHGDTKVVARQSELRRDAQHGYVSQIDAVQEAENEDHPEGGHEVEVDFAGDSFLERFGVVVFAHGINSGGRLVAIVFLCVFLAVGNGGVHCCGVGSGVQTTTQWD